jgi:hypothetical protein
MYLYSREIREGGCIMLVCVEHKSFPMGEDTGKALNRRS